MKLLATLATATALATPAAYVQAHQHDDGGFGDAQITAWATLALVAAGAETGRAAEYLAGHGYATAGFVGNPADVAAAGLSECTGNPELAIGVPRLLALRGGT